MMMEISKQPNLSVSEFPTMLTWNVYHAIKLNRKVKYSWLADNHVTGQVPLS